MSNSSYPKSSKAAAPKSSKAERAGVAIQAYSAMQLRSMAADSADMKKSLRDISETARNLEESQNRANGYLYSIDMGVRNLEQSALEANLLLTKSNDIAEQQLLQTKIANERDEWRDQRDQLQKQLEKEESEVVQQVKNILHLFDRRLQLLPAAGMTSLEIYFFAQQLLETVTEIAPDILPDISDKKYRDEVEDNIRLTIEKAKKDFSEQDKIDLVTIIEIEREDENVECAGFLSDVEAQLSLFVEVESITKKVSRYKSLSNAVAKEFKNEISKLSKLIGEIQ